MQCLGCLCPIPEGAKVCPNCGVIVSDETVLKPIDTDTQVLCDDPVMTKEKFKEHPNLKNYCDNIKGAAIILYICAVLSVVGAIMMGSSVPLDSLIIAAFALGIQLGQSRACAIGVLIYSIINLGVAMYATGRPAGTLIVIGAINAVIYTFQFQKAWKVYQKTGMLPVKK